jgi:hypothetical protein
MSTVLNARPFMPAEKIKLWLPCSDEIWLTADMAAWQNRGQEHDYNDGMLYAELARISIDRSEPMPHLSFPKQDLILFATQESVWRFCHNPDMFDRMTGRKVTEADSPSSNTSDGEFSAPKGEIWPSHKCKSNSSISTMYSKLADALGVDDRCSAAQL